MTIPIETRRDYCFFDAYATCGIRDTERQTKWPRERGAVGGFKAGDHEKKRPKFGTIDEVQAQLSLFLATQRDSRPKSWWIFRFPINEKCRRVLVVRNWKAGTKSWIFRCTAMRESYVDPRFTYDQATRSGSHCWWSNDLTALVAQSQR